MSKVVFSPIQKFTNGATTRLARKAGITRLTSIMHEEIRALSEHYLQTVVQKAVTIIQHDKVETIQTKHVRLALESLNDVPRAISHTGPALGACPKNYKTLLSERRAKSTSERTRRVRNGTGAFREVKHYSNTSSTCFVIAETAISALVRYHAAQANGGKPVRFSANALTMLQLDLELMMVEMLTDARLIAVTSGKVTVKPAHIQLARRIRGENL
jgi:histone H3/H4